MVLNEASIINWINTLAFPNALLVDSLEDLKDGIVLLEILQPWQDGEQKHVSNVCSVEEARNNLKKLFTEVTRLDETFRKHIRGENMNQVINEIFSNGKTGTSNFIKLISAVKRIALTKKASIKKNDQIQGDANISCGLRSVEEVTYKRETYNSGRKGLRKGTLWDPTYQKNVNVTSKGNAKQQTNRLATKFSRKRSSPSANLHVSDPTVTSISTSKGIVEALERYSKCSFTKMEWGIALQWLLKSGNAAHVLLQLEGASIQFRHFSDPQDQFGALQLLAELFSDGVFLCQLVFLLELRRGRILKEVEKRVSDANGHVHCIMTFPGVTLFPKTHGAKLKNVQIALQALKKNRKFYLSRLLLAEKLVKFEEDRTSAIELLVDMRNFYANEHIDKAGVDKNQNIQNIEESKQSLSEFSHMNKQKSNITTHFLENTSGFGKKDGLENDHPVTQMDSATTSNSLFLTGNTLNDAFYIHSLALEMMDRDIEELICWLGDVGFQCNQKELLSGRLSERLQDGTLFYDILSVYLPRFSEKTKAQWQFSPASEDDIRSNISLALRGLYEIESLLSIPCDEVAKLVVEGGLRFLLALLSQFKRSLEPADMPIEYRSGAISPIKSDILPMNPTPVVKLEPRTNELIELEKQLFQWMESMGILGSCPYEKDGLIFGNRAIYEGIKSGDLLIELTKECLGTWHINDLAYGSETLSAPMRIEISLRELKKHLPISTEFFEHRQNILKGDSRLILKLLKNIHDCIECKGQEALLGHESMYLANQLEVLEKPRNLSLQTFSCSFIEQTKVIDIYPNKACGQNASKMQIQHSLGPAVSGLESKPDIYP